MRSHGLSCIGLAAIYPRRRSFPLGLTGLSVGVVGSSCVGIFLLDPTLLGCRICGHIEADVDLSLPESVFSTRVEAEAREVMVSLPHPSRDSPFVSIFFSSKEKIDDSPSRERTSRGSGSTVVPSCHRL